MADVGRPSDLTEELTLRIRKLVLDSTSYREIQEILDISPNTWDSWVHRNTQGFRDDLNKWKYERIVKTAEAVIESSMTEDDKRVRLDAAKFSLERLNKDFKNKTETDITSNGKELGVVILPKKDEDSLDTTA